VTCYQIPSIRLFAVLQRFTRIGLPLACLVLFLSTVSAEDAPKGSKPDPVPVTRDDVKRMLDASWAPPSWELAMARKDARLMLDAAAQAGVPLAVLPAIAARMDAVIAEGHGAKDWTIIAKDVVAK